MPTPPVQSVLKALGVLDTLAFDDARGDGLALSELARRASLRPNTLHNLLRSLILAGYAEQAPGGRYRAGPKCRRLGLRNRLAPWLEAARPILDRLVDETGESTVAYVLDGGERARVYQRESTQRIRVTLPGDGPAHFFRYVTCRVLAAWSGEEARRELVVRHGLPGAAFDGIRSRAALERALDEIRAAGCARRLSHDGQLVDLAVPVLDPSGALLAAFGCYVPGFRCDAARERELLAALRHAAHEVGAVPPSIV